MVVYYTEVSKNRCIAMSTQIMNWFLNYYLSIIELCIIIKLFLPTPVFKELYYTRCWGEKVEYISPACLKELIG